MRRRLLPAIIFIGYIVILVRVMVFKNIPNIRVGHLMFNFSGTYEIHPANFVPFKTIFPYLLGNKGWIIAGVNLAGNIIPLVPLGFLLPLIFQNITWKKTLVVGIASGLAIEIMQSILHVGIFDIDDVLLNALGVIAGFGIFLLLSKWVRERKYIYLSIVGILFLVIAACGLYAVYPRGQRLMNPGVKDSLGRNKENTNARYANPCGDTPGTGGIVSIGNHTITIRRNDNVIQKITLTARTVIRNSMGPASEADLKVGDRVTVVINEGEIASVVLICGVAVK